MSEDPRDKHIRDEVARDQGYANEEDMVHDFNERDGDGKITDYGDNYDDDCDDE